MVRRVVDFMRYNHEKKMTVKVYLYTAYYRLCLLIFPMTHMEKIMGIRGEESDVTERKDNLRLARLVGFHVNRVTAHLPLKRKCWVRALTARKILMGHGVNSTLYMGLGKDEGRLVAHAWLRCGQMYVTGGDGAGYAMVAKFRAF
jgi:hypothetical protein